MASTTQDELYKIFAEISRSQTTEEQVLLDAGEGLAESASEMWPVGGGAGASRTTSPRAAAQSGSGSASESSIESSAGGPATQTTGTQSTTVPPASGNSVVIPAATLLGTSSGANTNAATTTQSTANVVSTLLSSVFSGVPLASEISGGSTTGGGSTLESVASTVLKSGFGIVPLISGLAGLFGGGGSAAPTPLVKYAMPSKIDYEEAETASGLVAADYDQQGNSRAYSSPGTAASSGGGGAPAQITVNVSAMDARSFMDRSNDIAAAVRDAMLNLNAINDVVSDL